MQKSDCIIGVEHVSKFFGDKAVLNDVNLSVRKGEFVTILGPSGCGKTTLLRLIAGFQTASEGVITIAGKDITQTPPHRRPVNTVFQKYALFPHLNVFNNIAFGLKLKKLPAATIEKKVKQALRMAGMTDYEDRDVDSLRRRVELQNSGLYDKTFVFIADAQALTDNMENPEKRLQIESIEIINIHGKGCRRKYLLRCLPSSRRNGCTSVSLSAARHGVTSAAQAILRDWCSRKCRVLSPMCRTAGDTPARK